MSKFESFATGTMPTVMLQSTEIPAEHIARAKLTVASNAKNVDDARALLEMLGLVEPVKATTPNPEGK